MAKPSNRLHPPDDFVTGNEWKLRLCQLAIDDVQVGAADAASEQLKRSWRGDGSGIGSSMSLSGDPADLEHHRLHGRSRQVSSS
jgi:hypothetical protein